MDDLKTMCERRRLGRFASMAIQLPGDRVMSIRSRESGLREDASISSRDWIPVVSSFLIDFVVVTITG
tara:strand:+ start:582 stop:785 length:204 start_codon:yes stop_codon:yes gene_type:complete